MREIDWPLVMRKYAAQELEVPLEEIVKAELGVVYTGYCETCEDETFGINVDLKNYKCQSIEKDATTILNELFVIANQEGA